MEEALPREPGFASTPLVNGVRKVFQVGDSHQPFTEYGAWLKRLGYGANAGP